MVFSDRCDGWLRTPEWSCTRGQPTIEDPAGTHRWVAQLVDVTLDPARPACSAARLELPGEPLSVPMARSFVSELLGQWDLDGLVPASELLVSELVANAVQHVPGRCAVELTCHADVAARSPCPTRVPACPTCG